MILQYACHHFVQACKVLKETGSSSPSDIKLSSSDVEFESSTLPLDKTSFPVERVSRGEHVFEVSIW